MQVLSQTTSFFIDRSKNSYYWGRILIFISIIAVVFYMHYSQTIIEQKYNWNWFATNLTDVPITVSHVSDENATYINIITTKADAATDEDENNTTQSTINRGIHNETTTAIVRNVDLRIKNILQWSPGRNSPFYHMGKGRTNFYKLSCPYTNCYVTDNRRYLPNITQFDAIIFNGNFVIFKDKKDLPQYRSQKQIYVFGATESAHNNPACKPVLDNFFNWTYTYRLDSDVRWSYILIYDKDGNEVGPKANMVWPKEMDPIDEDTKAILDGKSKTAAWYVSHCNTLSHREDFVKKLQSELKKIDSNMMVDVYGSCGSFSCSRASADRCYGLIKKHYYFYLSFENSFAVDYVTEKLLTALNNFAIPVVFSGVDYSRYLPPGSYLNARELGPEKLAATMKDITDNRTRYHDFFRWRNHFRYKQGENDTEICNLCTALNDQQKVSTTRWYGNFRSWWYEDWEKDYKCK